MQRTRRASLIFKDIYQLWSFAQSIQVRSATIIPHKCALICYCSGFDIERAQEHYKANVEAVEIVDAKQVATI